MAICTSNLTSGFIDLATYDEQEKYMYGGRHATAYFVRETRKSTWFTQVPVVLSKCSGSPEFGAEWSVQISRAGDYLLQTWLRVELPKVEVNNTSGNRIRIRWTRNVGHALIKECCLTFNDLVAARFDNYHLDFWTAFTTPASKRNGYDNMIGNVIPLTGHGADPLKLDSHMLNVPLPFFYTRDSGVALPTAALPYNDMRIQFQFRGLEELLIVDECDGTRERSLCTLPAGVTYVGGEPKLKNVAVWANYAIVSNDERKRMACAPRDILIEQVQTAPPCGFHPKATTTPEQYDVRFSHAIKCLFFAVRNKTLACEHANYTTSPATTFDTNNATDFDTTGFDPIREASLLYENTVRLGCMGSDFYSLVEPYYKAPAIPMVTGYHMYSYSLDFYNLDPMGSTNFGKLTNVGLRICPSEEAVKAAAGQLVNEAGNCGRGNNYDEQKFEFVVTAVNNNIVRISGGALGFPVL